MSGLFDMSGKAMIVTGGNGYLGKAICEGLSQCGANLVIASRNGEACREYAGELSERHHTQAVGVSADILDTGSIRSLFGFAAERFGKIDVLFNNAFVPVHGPLESMSDGLWSKGMDGTANAVFRCIREVLPYMLENGKGKIVNIASMYGVIAPNPAAYGGDASLGSPACYGAGKAAIIQLTRYIAAYYGRRGITANCISPGAFPNEDAQKNAEFMGRLQEKTMLGRTGQPEDLMGIAAFLASDASGYITGQNICVDGGVTAW